MTVHDAAGHGNPAGRAQPQPGSRPQAQPENPPRAQAQAQPQAGSAQRQPGSAQRQPRVRLTAWVDGLVQGVGFRWWVRSRALELGLTGSATNLPDGRVQVIAEGPRPACATLLTLLRGPGTPGRVTNVGVRWSEPGPSAGGEAGPSRFVSR